MFDTKEEADAWVAAYDRDRCVCGGSPLRLDPADHPMHRADCDAMSGEFTHALCDHDYGYCGNEMAPDVDPGLAATPEPTP